PRRQVVISRMRKPPTTTGSQPPSASFCRFEVRKESSSKRSGSRHEMHAVTGHSQRWRQIGHIRIVSMVIVIITAMPYAVASDADERKPSTHISTNASRTQFTNGT